MTPPPPNLGSPLAARESQRSYTRPTQRASLGARTALLMMLVILTSGLVVAGWLIADQHQKVRAMRAGLAEVTETIQSLNSRVRATDENVSAAGADVSDALGFWEEETRKLWDISNKRNKSWIEKNQQAINVHKSDIAQIREALKRETETLQSLAKEVQDRSRSMDDLAGSIEQVIRQQRDVQDKLNILTRELASLKGTVEERVGNNEEAIASMDQFRRYVNGRLEDITDKIGGSGP